MITDATTHTCLLEKPQPSSTFILPLSDDGMPTTQLMSSGHLQVSASTTSILTSQSRIQACCQTTTRDVSTASIAESHLEVRKATSSDNVNTCNKSILDIHLSKTLDVASTLNEKDCNRFWDSRCQDVSTHLSLPIKTDFPASDSTLLIMSSSPQVAKSWFSINSACLPRTSSSKTLQLSYTSSAAESTGPGLTKPNNNKALATKICLLEECKTEVDLTTNNYYCPVHLQQLMQTSKTCKAVCTQGKKRNQECGATASNGCFCKRHAVKTTLPVDNPTPQKLKTLKIKLRPTKDQIVEFRKWFGVARKYYNEALEVMKEDRHKDLGSSLANIRPIVQSRLSGLPYCKAVPDKIRQGGVADACKAVSNAKLKCKQTGAFQNCKFRSKKDLRQSIYIINRAVTSKKNSTNSRRKGYDFTIHERVSQLGPISAEEAMPDSPATSYRLSMDRNQIFYLCVPVPLGDLSDRTNTVSDFVSLDPGCRTFQTFYSQVAWGTFQQNQKKMDNLHKEISILRSKHDQRKNIIKDVNKKPSTKRRRLHKKRLKGEMATLRKRYLTLYSRQTRVVTEMHRKAANHLLKNFKVTFIPMFQTSRLKELESSRPETNREYDTYAHYRFKEYLKFKAQEYSGRHVMTVSEAYTTRCCSKCGMENDVGAAKVFKCRACGLKTGRDLNAAKNILIRSLMAF